MKTATKENLGEGKKKLTSFSDCSVLSFLDKMELKAKEGRKGREEERVEVEREKKKKNESRRECKMLEVSQGNYGLLNIQYFKLSL